MREIGQGLLPSDVDGSSCGLCQGTLWTMTCSTIHSPTFTQPKQLQGSISDATPKTSSPQLLLSPYQPLISRQTSHGITAATQLHSPSHLAQGEVQLGWSRRPQLSNREDLHWVDGIDLGNPAALACRVPGDVPTISGRCPNMYVASAGMRWLYL